MKLKTLAKIALISLPLIFGSCNKKFTGKVKFEFKNSNGEYIYKIKGQAYNLLNVYSKEDIFNEGDIVTLTSRWNGRDFEYFNLYNGRKVNVKVPKGKIKDYKIFRKSE